MAVSFILTIIPLFVAKIGIITQRSSLFVAYAIGAAIGTGIGMMIKLKGGK
jgi:hypothetical protein